jgi:hypothetical protein
MTGAPKIIISRDGAEFVVAIEPPVEGVNHSARYPAHGDAFGYAVGLRMTHGWAVVDLGSGAPIVDMLGIGGAK